MASITSDIGNQSGTLPKAAQPDAPTQEPMIWVNGQMMPKSQASVSVFDHGLLYGDGIFEGIRVYNGKIFKLQQHMDRLYECADKIFLDIGVSREEMIKIQRQCVQANNITNGYIRLVVTRGEGSLGLNPYQCPKAGVICIADTIALFKPEMYEKGMRVVLANRPKTPIECLDPRVKTLNYLNNIMAKVEARGPAPRGHHAQHRRQGQRGLGRQHLHHQGWQGLHTPERSRDPRRYHPSLRQG